ncbi:hypothetical protein V8C42DRAFT_137383 [Trichoderma barbatum]
MAFHLDGQFAGIHLPIFFFSFLLQHRLPLARATYWNARHDPCHISFPPSRRGHRAMYNGGARRFYIINSKGYTTLGTRKKQQKRMGLFRLQNGIFRIFFFFFVLHIDLGDTLLAFRTYWSRFGKISFSFRSWSRPFAGIVPMQAQAKCGLPTALVGLLALLLFFIVQ